MPDANEAEKAKVFEGIEIPEGVFVDRNPTTGLYDVTARIHFNGLGPSEARRLVERLVGVLMK